MIIVLLCHFVLLSFDFLSINQFIYKSKKTNQSKLIVNKVKFINVIINFQDKYFLLQ